MLDFFRKKQIELNINGVLRCGQLIYSRRNYHNVLVPNSPKILLVFLGISNGRNPISILARTTYQIDALMLSNLTFVTLYYYSIHDIYSDISVVDQDCKETFAV